MIFVLAPIHQFVDKHTGIKKKTPPPPKNEIVNFLLNIELWLYRTFCLTEKVYCFVYTPSLYSFKPSWNRLYIVHIGNQYIVLQIIQRKLPLLC